MCGIYLEICRDNHFGECPFNESNVDSIKKRGCDSLVTKKVGRFFIAFSRLAIRDLQFGNQPYDFGEWTTLINGELDNFNSLHEELGYDGDQSLLPSGDMQILGHAFSLFKEKALEYSRGFYAGAAINSQKQEVYFFRDKVGEKPLFFFVDDSHLVISSDPCDREGFPTVENELVRKFLARGHNLKGETIFSSIRKVMPGELIKFNLCTWKYEKKCFWSWQERNRKNQDEVLPNNNSNIEIFRKKLERELSGAIESQLNNDVETGILLSGGLDSTLIAYMANRDREKKFPAFTLGFMNKSYDESLRADQIAKLLQIPQKSFRPNDQEFVKALPEVIDAMREPILDTATISLYLLSRFVSREVKVALSGDGGDELFRGYELYRRLELIQNIAEICGHFPQFIKIMKLISPALRFFSKQRYTSIAMKTDRLISLLEHRSVESAVIALSPISGVREFEFLFDEIVSDSGSIKCLTREHLDKVYREYILPDVYLCKSDRMSMYHGLEIRSPFLAPQVVNLIMEYDRFLQQYSKVEILLPILPQGIQKLLINSKKHGFAPPLNDYFSGYTISSGICGVLRISKSEVDRVKSRAAKGDQNAVMAFWSVLILDHYMNRNNILAT